MKHASDWRSLAFAMITLAMLITPFFANIPLWIVPFWVLLNACLCFSCCCITHNHIHCGTFTSARWNTGFNLLLTLAKGHTATTIIVPHMLNHHQHSGHQDDWINPREAGESRGVLRLISYTLRASIRMNRERKVEGAPSLTSRQMANLRLERVVLLVWIALWLWADPIACIIFMGIPWITAMLWLVAVNLLQHDGCDPDTEFNHSRNFTGRFGNWFLFNNGYHTIHHLKPSLHWSLLADAHDAEVSGFMNPALNHSSILSYLWKTYLLPQAASPSESHAQESRSH